MPALSVCLVTLPLFEDGLGRFGGQPSSTDVYNIMSCHTIPYHTIHNMTYHTWVGRVCGADHEALTRLTNQRGIPAFPRINSNSMPFFFPFLVISISQAYSVEACAKKSKALATTTRIITYNPVLNPCNEIKPLQCVLRRTIVARGAQQFANTLFMNRPWGCKPAF